MGVGVGWLEDEFNAWYEGEYIPKLMRMTPHFRVCRRYKGEFNGQTLYVTDYETTSETRAREVARTRSGCGATSHIQTSKL